MFFTCKVLFKIYLKKKKTPNTLTELKSLNMVRDVKSAPPREINEKSGVEFCQIFEMNMS